MTFQVEMRTPIRIQTQIQIQIQIRMSIWTMMVSRTGLTMVPMMQIPIKLIQTMTDSGIFVIRIPSLVKTFSLSLWIMDYLARYRADRAYTVNFAKEGPHSRQSIQLEGTTATPWPTIRPRT